MIFYYGDDEEVRYEPDEDEIKSAAAVIIGEDIMPYQNTAIYSKKELNLIREGIELGVNKMLQDYDIDVNYLYDDIKDYLEETARRYAMDIDTEVY